MEISNYITDINIQVNKILFNHYHEMDLNEQELVVLLKLIERSKKSNIMDFNNVAEETSLSNKEIINIIKHLLNTQFLDMKTVQIKGKTQEIFDITPAYKKLITFMEQSTSTKQKTHQKTREVEKSNGTIELNQVGKLFEYIERLYGRALSPNEYETMKEWLKNNSFDDIKNAVDLAYQNQVQSFHYVGRILHKNKTSAHTHMPMKSWLNGEDIFD